LDEQIRLDDFYGEPDNMRKWGWMKLQRQAGRWNIGGFILRVFSLRQLHVIESPHFVLELSYKFEKSS
jgi:hypothetical protein